MKNINLEWINKDSFAPYGTVIELDENGENPIWQIPVIESNDPWRIALLKVLPTTLDKLEAHPYSRERFEPMSGWSVLFTALPETPHNIKAFLLDRPVCLFKGIWHGIITLTPESVCKITENAEVECDYLNLGFSLQPEIVVSANMPCNI